MANPLINSGDAVLVVYVGAYEGLYFKFRRLLERLQ